MNTSRIRNLAISRIQFTLSVLTATCALAATVSAQPEPGFVSLFDGKTLAGWKSAGGPRDGYGVTNGAIFCSPNGRNLFTEQSFSDFVLRFEFKLDDGSNNGIGIRAPLEGDAAYAGMEIQILEDAAADRGKWGKLRAEQYHGSIYDLVAAKRGALKPAGQWNTEEITAEGRRIKVVVNGITIVDANLNDIADAGKIRKHPGLFSERGHIGFLGHGDYLEFRNIRIKDLARPEADNAVPAGFTALFNGRDLTGWKGLLNGPNDNPIKRAALTPQQRTEAQKEADDDMREHWKVENGALAFDGKGRSLCTAKDYADFEMLVDWKIPGHGDSGIYLRGSPQVQIWDPHTQPTGAGSDVGSGGLYNNQKHPSKPLKVADKPIGEWNRFRIVMVGERLHVFLNGELVVQDTVLENYWDRTQAIFPTGQIELQNHGGPLWFKNIHIREISSK
jgi:hypothetical protein